MPIYMKYDGIDGNVQVQDFMKWIELKSAALSTHRDITSGGSGRGREASHPHVSEIQISKELDAASSKLFRASLVEDHDKKVKIAFTTTGTDKPETYLTLELKDCLISSYSISGAGHGAHPMEALTLSFTEITYTPSLASSSGKHEKGAVVTFDMKKMAVS